MASSATGASNDGLATAIGKYVLEEITLGKAAEEAGLSRWEFEAVLEEAGFAVRYGPRSQTALEDEVDVALDLDE